MNENPSYRLIVVKPPYEVRPNMYCHIDGIEFYWDAYDTNEPLPICPFHSIERNTLNWIGT